MKITLQQLIDARACQSQVDLFRELFGDEVEVTEEACIAVADKFDFYWAAKHLLSAPAWAEYVRVMAPAWAGYKRVTAPAWAECWRVMAAAFGRLYSSPAKLKRKP